MLCAVLHIISRHHPIDSAQMRGDYSKPAINIILHITTRKTEKTRRPMTGIDPCKLYTYPYHGMYDNCACFG